MPYHNGTRPPSYLSIGLFAYTPINEINKIKIINIGSPYEMFSIFSAQILAFLLLYKYPRDHLLLWISAYLVS